MSPTAQDPIRVSILKRVTPEPANPVDPLSEYIPRSAKYVNEFSHSTRTPLVVVIASTPGVINVALLNNIVA